MLPVMQVVPVQLVCSFEPAGWGEALQREGARLGLSLAVTTQRLDPGGLERADPPAGARVVVLLLRPEELEPELHRHGGRDPADVALGRLADRVVGLAARLRETGRATLLVASAALPAGPASASRTELALALQRYNVLLGQRLAELEGCHVFDWGEAVAQFGSARFRDARRWYQDRAVCGEAALAFVAERLARRLAAELLPRAKCLVVDLDDTLWGGAVGDDGVDGIQLGDGYPGNVYRDFQHHLKQLSQQGLLLAIASKNDEATVRDAFSRHPHMVLRLEDFAATRISWQRKPDSLCQIAEELGLGRDSLVFLDDNPVECGAVTAALPEVQVVCLGRDPLQFVPLLEGIAALDRPVLTREDRLRGGMYQAERQRRQRETSLPQSRDKFLASLGMKARVAPADRESLPRVVQLIGKTNQFNLTCRRHGADEIRCLLDAADARVVTLQLEDTFGDLGLVCVGILRRQPTAAHGSQSWLVDTLLMSCRAMGRGVEDAFLACLVETARQAGACQLLGEHVPSERNHIVRDFFSQRGFTAQPSEPDRPEPGSTFFTLDLGAAEHRWPAHIQRVS
jgi:FkbH-like protein